MSVRVRGFLLVGSLVVGSWFQGCASRPPVVKAAPGNPAAQNGAAVTVPTAVHKEESLPVADESLSIAPSHEGSVTSQSPTTPAPAIQPRPESAPPVTPPGEVVRPVVTVKPNAKPVAEVDSKPAAKGDPDSPAKTETKQAPRTTPASKPTLQLQPAPVNVEPEPMAEPESPPSLTVVEEDVAVTLESLPITIEGEWVLSASGDTCNLSTVPIQFDDGQGMSKLQLVFTPQHWLLKTQSDIDLSYSGTGLTVDDGPHFPLGQLVRESDLMFIKEYEAMTKAFVSGKTLHITLGFWPTWPVTETKTITISLQHFASAHRAWKQCLSLIDGR